MQLRVMMCNVQCACTACTLYEYKVRSFNRLPTCADVLVLFTLQKNTLYIVQSNVKASFLLKITFRVLSIIR